MKTKMNSTSLEAYSDILPKQAEAQRKVLKALRELGEATNKDIATHLNWEINRVTGRMNELVNARGLVAFAGYSYKTGRKATLWKVKKYINN